MYPPAGNGAANAATASGDPCGTCRSPRTEVEPTAAGFEKALDGSLENSGLLWEQPAAGWWRWQWLSLPTQLPVGGPKTKSILGLPKSAEVKPFVILAVLCCVGVELQSFYDFSVPFIVNLSAFIISAIPVRAGRYEDVE